jgi:hypothetical protein
MFIKNKAFHFIFRCKKQCFKKVPQLERIAVLIKVYSFARKDARDLYLQGLIEVQDMKRKVHRIRAQRKEAVISRIMLVFLRRVAMCKKAFVSLHGVTDNRAR